MANQHSQTRFDTDSIPVQQSYQKEDYHEFTTTYRRDGQQEKQKFTTWIGEKVKGSHGIGALCGAIAGVACATLKALPSLTPSWSPVQVISYGFIMTMLLSLAQALCTKSPMTGVKGERIVLVLRSTCFAVGVLLLYLSLHYISLGMLASIGSGQTVLVALFARIILKEPFYIFDAISGIFMVIGVILIANPTSVFGGDDVPEPIGIVFACSAILFLALNTTLSGKLHCTSNATVMFYASFAGSLTGIAYLLIMNELMGFTAWHDVILVLIVGCVDWAFMNLFLAAFIWLPAALVILSVVSVNTLASYAFQVILHHEFPTLATILGAVLIFCCILAVTIRSLAFPPQIPKITIGMPQNVPVVSTPMDKSPLLPYRAVSVASESGILRSPVAKGARRLSYLQVPGSPGPLLMM